MATLLVRIKADTLRRNPRAGQPRLLDVPGRTEHSKTEILRIPGGWRREQSTSFDGKDWRLQTFVEVVDPFGEAAKPDDWRPTYGSMTPLTQLFDYGVEPDYLFEYENPVFDCNNCRATLQVNDLESDYYPAWGDFDGMQTETKCPRCHVWSAVELLHETVQQALERLEPYPEEIP